MNLSVLTGQIYRGGRVVDPFGVGRGPFALADAWPGDLLAYRQEWEPFVAAHVAQWRNVHDLLSQLAASDGVACPTTDDMLKDPKSAISRINQAYPDQPYAPQLCGDIAVSDAKIDPDRAGSIPWMWNAWAGKSPADIVAAAPTMLKWHQDTVATVGGQYKDDLMAVAGRWKIRVDLPDTPTFSMQQYTIAQIEGAYVAAKGVLQIGGYAAGQTLAWTGDQIKAVAEGLSTTAKKLPAVLGNPWTWIGVAGVFALVAGGLVVYYAPRKEVR